MTTLANPPDVNSGRSHREKSGDLGVLVVRPEVEMEAVLCLLPFGDNNLLPIESHEATGQRDDSPPGLAGAPALRSMP